MPCRAGQQGDRLTKLLFELTIWRGLLALGEPFRRLVAFYLFFGRSLWTAGGDLTRLLWRAIGWLSAPPRGAFWKPLGQGLVELKRWHLTLGEFAGPSSAICLPSDCLVRLSHMSAPACSGLRSLHSHLTSFATVEGVHGRAP